MKRLVQSTRSTLAWVKTILHFHMDLLQLYVRTILDHEG